jgi:hypothetical protein
LSLIAHLPGGVEFVRMGGFGVVGFLLLRMGLQME